MTAILAALWVTVKLATLTTVILLLLGTPLAWWSLGGLLVTTFAFLGVNMFLSGLHSYGQL